MNLALVLPICSKDAPAALRNLAWCLRLNPDPQPLTCLVFHESNLDASAVLSAARRCFTDVREVAYAPYRGPATWPNLPNYAFFIAASTMARNPDSQPWLWWEQDAIPLTPDWLSRLATAYAAARKPFMGALGQTATPTPPRHLNGVAIYPFNAITLYPALRGNSATAFDVAGGPRVLAQAHLSPLFQHIYSWESGPSMPPPTFPDDASLSRLRPEAVLFHRCKDGSLIDRLTSRGIPTPLPATPTASPVSLIQTLMRWKYGTGKWTIFFSKRKRVSISVSIPEPRLIHCVERHKQSTKDAERRVLQAQESWVTLYKTTSVIPAHTWEPDRHSGQIGDSRCLPYLKDVLLMGLNTGSPSDWLIWTNDDTILHPTLPDYLLSTLSKKPALSSFRINFDRGAIPDLSKSPRDLLALSHRLKPPGDIDLGRDLFAFRKDWLREHWHEIPDFFLGELEFDLVLAYLIRKHAGIHTTKLNMAEIVPECEMPKGYVLHERHNRQWTNPGQESSAAKLWNRKLATEFYCDNELHSLVTSKF